VQSVLYAAGWDNRSPWGQYIILFLSFFCFLCECDYVNMGWFFWSGLMYVEQANKKKTRPPPVTDQLDVVTGKHVAVVDADLQRVLQ
jgi:hypothetical protein